MLKLKMMLCVMMLLPLVVVDLHIKAVCQSVREATPPPAWIMQPPRRRGTAEQDYFTLREADHCKNNWEE